MASPLSAVPKATFTHHSLQLQRRLASTTAAPLPAGLFKPPHSIIKPWKAIAGAQEWQTSAYHYNKQTLKTLPTAAVTADKLLQDYATMIKASSRSSSANAGAAGAQAARSGIGARRRQAERIYMSGTTAKDFGDHVVVNAFMFDGVESAKEEKERFLAERKEQARKAAESGAPGSEGGMSGREKRGGAPGVGGRRRPPMRIGGAGGAPGARRMVPGGTRTPRAPVSSGLGPSSGGGSSGFTIRKV